MKLTTGILTVVMMTGAAWGQNPAATDNARSSAKSLTQTKTNGAALVATANPAPAAKPAPGAPASAVKPAPAAAPAQAADKSAAGQNNTLERVNVVRNANDIQIELKSREAVTPKVSKLSS